MTKIFAPSMAQKEPFEPVEKFLLQMQKAGIPAFENPGEWEKCLCALVLSLDPKCRVFQFIEALPYQRESYAIHDILNSMANMGYYAKRTRINIDDIDPRLLPCLYMDGKNRPVLLLMQEGGRIKIFKDGDILYVTPDYMRNTQGDMYFFERYDESRSSLSRFVRQSTEQSWFQALFGRFDATLRAIFFTGLFLNIFSLVTPLFIMLIYNRVISTGSLDILPMIALGMFMAIGFEMSLRGLRSKGLSWISARMDNIVGNRIFSHLIGLPPALIERASVSSQIARVRTFESIRDFFCGSVFLSIIELPFVALALVAIYFIAGPLVLVPLFMSTLYAVLFYAVYKKVRVSIRLAAKTSSARQQFTIEAFEKILAIRSYGLTTLWEEKYRDLSGKESFAQFRLAWLGIIGETLAHGITLLAAVATIGFGAHLIWNGTISTGALVATMILVWRVLTPFYSICTIIPRLEQLRNSILQVNKLMDIQTERQSSAYTSRLPRLRGGVTFKSVGLRYAEQSDAVFSNLNFQAMPGDLVTITGDNGAGKSSILKLVKGLYTASEGSVQIDGFDLRQLDAPDLRRHIAYVPQQPDFFEGTIIENLRIANPLASKEDIYDALDLAAALEDINALPEQISTSISRYNAAKLPANLMIKLSLARLYLHPAPILLIDELPNTLLSAQTGRDLREYLARIKGERTCLMVTYREDILKMSDSIVLMRVDQTPRFGNSQSILQSMMEAA